jgi:hypothetical protein
MPTVVLVDSGKFVSSLFVIRGDRPFTAEDELDLKLGDRAQPACDHPPPPQMMTSSARLSASVDAAASRANRWSQERTRS